MWRATHFASLVRSVPVGSMSVLPVCQTALGGRASACVCASMPSPTLPSMAHACVVNARVGGSAPRPSRQPPAQRIPCASV